LGKKKKGGTVLGDIRFLDQENTAFSLGGWGEGVWLALLGGGREAGSNNFPREKTLKTQGGERKTIVRHSFCTNGEKGK